MPRKPKTDAIAKEIEAVVEEADREAAPPTFTLSADRPLHIRALMAALHELPEEEKPEARRMIREFDLYEERNRERKR